MAQREEALRHEVMIVVKANGLPITGELWLRLIFLNEAQLTSLLQQLNANPSALRTPS